MEENLWLLDNDFGILRDHGILSDDNIAVVRAPFVRDAKMKAVKTEWVILCVLRSGDFGVYDRREGILPEGARYGVGPAACRAHEGVPF